MASVKNWIEHLTTDVDAATEGVQVADIACGLNYTLLLLHNGTVLSWGVNESGALGHGDKSDRGTSESIHTLLSIVIVQIACGSSHSLCLSDNGDLWTFGNSEYG